MSRQAQLIILTADRQLAKNVCEPDTQAVIRDRFKEIRRLDQAGLDKLYASLDIDRRYNRLEGRSQSGVFLRCVLKTAKYQAADDPQADPDFASDDAAALFASGGYTGAALFGFRDPSSPDGYTVADVAAFNAYMDSLAGKQPKGVGDPGASAGHPVAVGDVDSPGLVREHFASEPAFDLFDGSTLEPADLGEPGSGSASEGRFSKADVEAALAEQGGGDGEGSGEGDDADPAPADGDDDDDPEGVADIDPAPTGGE